MIRTMIQVKDFGREVRVLTKCTKCGDSKSEDKKLSYVEIDKLWNTFGTWIDMPTKKCCKCELVLLDASGDEA